MFIGYCIMMSCAESTSFISFTGTLLGSAVVPEVQRRSTSS